MISNLQDFEVIITGREMAEKVKSLLQSKGINNLLLPKCKGVPLKFNIFEFLGFIEVKKAMIIFRCDEEMRKVVLQFILKYFNKKNNGIMFTVKGDFDMEYENVMFVGIVNAGKGEKLADLVRKNCHAGATIFDARGSGADTESFMGIEIDSNKEVVTSVMPKAQLAKIKSSIKKHFDKENTDVVTFSMPITDFNKLHQ